MTYVKRKITKRRHRRSRRQEYGRYRRYKRARREPPTDSSDSDESDDTESVESIADTNTTDDNSYTLGDEDTVSNSSAEEKSKEKDAKKMSKSKAMFILNIGKLAQEVLNLEKLAREDGSDNEDDSDNEQATEEECCGKNPELKYYSKEEKTYYNKLDDEARARLDFIEARIKEINENNCGIPRRFKLLNSEMDERSKATVIQKLDYLDRMSGNESEYIKLSFWMDAVMRLPFGRYKELPVNSNSSRIDIKALLVKTKANLDQRVYGHNEVKDHIVRILAQWVSNPQSKGMVIGIQGSPGVGKTTLVKNGVCNSLDLPFVFVPLGGMADRSEFVGHSYTYEGARWGKIVDSLMVAGYSNPVFFFDELDKVSGTKNGEEIINILMQLTDPTQNEKFHDSYFSDFSFDLSRCIMIFSYNNESEISPILRDRMIRIETRGYKLCDKLCIAQKHLIPDILQEFNIQPQRIRFDNEIIKFIIEFVEAEEGVRNLKRAIHDIISNMHLNMLIGEHDDEAKELTVTKQNVTKYVHRRREADNTSHNLMYL